LLAKLNTFSQNLYTWLQGAEKGRKRKKRNTEENDDVPLRFFDLVYVLGCVVIAVVNSIFNVVSSIVIIIIINSLMERLTDLNRTEIR